MWPEPDEETPLVKGEEKEKSGGWGKCCGICCCILLLLLLLFIFVGIQMIMQHLANQSTMRLETGSVRNIQSLGSVSQGVTADIRMNWEFSIPHLGDIVDLMEGNNKLGPSWDKMHGHTTLSNPTWDNVFMRSTTILIKGPASEGRKLFAEVKTPDANIPPGDHTVDFPTWIRVQDPKEADHVVADVLAVDTGGNIIVELHPTLKLFSFLDVQVHIFKALRCKATGDKLDGFPSFNNFDMKCDYIGNA